MSLVLPIAQRLADVLARDSFTLTEVGNRSRHSQDAVIGPCRQVERLRALDDVAIGDAYFSGAGSTWREVSNHFA